jgi:hypothetical protein
MRAAFLLVFTLALGAAAAATRPSSPGSPWERTVVTLEITRKQYDYIQPWSKRVETVQKTGIVAGPREVLTTADFMADSTLIRLQKGGRGRWFTGTVEWVDYHANLAIVSTTEAAFWTGLRPAKLADPIPTKGSVQLLRWRNGSFETRKAEINRLSVKRGKLTFVEHLQLEVDLEITGAGWSEPIVAENRVIGLTTWMEGNSCTALPTPFIGPILEARKNKTYRGLGFFSFTWRRAENPATLKYLKLEGEPRGVLVIDSSSLPQMDGQLKLLDVILQVDGHDVDIEGDYQNPVYGKLSIEDLASRGRWAGDQVRLKVLRGGQIQDVLYRLPRADYSIDLVPEGPFDQEPAYLIVGGLVFQPLNEPYMRSWGADWKRKAPFRLAYYDQEKPTPDRPALVVLSTVLPDPFNLGYQDYRYMVIEKFNGQKVSRLTDFMEAMKKPVDGFHVLEFGRSDVVRRIVLGASETDGATQRVLARYGIEKDRVFAERASGQ